MWRAFPLSPHLSHPCRCWRVLAWRTLKYSTAYLPTGEHRTSKDHTLVMGVQPTTNPPFISHYSRLAEGGRLSNVGTITNCPGLGSLSPRVTFACFYIFHFLYGFGFKIVDLEADLIVVNLLFMALIHNALLRRALLVIHQPFVWQQQEATPNRGFAICPHCWSPMGTADILVHIQYLWKSKFTQGLSRIWDLIIRFATSAL